MITHPARIIATAFVPDQKISLGSMDYGREYALIQQGECLYVVVYCNKRCRATPQQAYLNGEPIEFLLQRYFDGPPGQANEHGHLFFHDEEEALVWFAAYETKGGGTVTLLLEE